MLFLMGRVLAHMNYFFFGTNYPTTQIFAEQDAVVYVVLDSSSPVCLSALVDKPTSLYHALYPETLRHLVL